MFRGGGRAGMRPRPVGQRSSGGQHHRTRRGRGRLGWLCQKAKAFPVAPSPAEGAQLRSPRTYSPNHLIKPGWCCHTVMLLPIAGVVAFGCADGRVGVVDVRAQQQHMEVFGVRHSGPAPHLAWLSPPHPLPSRPAAGVDARGSAAAPAPLLLSLGGEGRLLCWPAAASPPGAAADRRQGFGGSGGGGGAAADAAPSDVSCAQGLGAGVTRGRGRGERTTGVRGSLLSPEKVWAQHHPCPSSARCLTSMGA